LSSRGSFTTRTLGSDDVETMRALLGVFGAVFDEPATYCSAQPSSDYLERLLNSDSFVAVVALEGDEVIGGLTAYELLKYEQERSEIYIYDLAVASASRRRGVATALIDELRGIAKVRGAWVVFVQADLGDEPAIALYTKTWGPRRRLALRHRALVTGLLCHGVALVELPRPEVAGERYGHAPRDRDRSGGAHGCTLKQRSQRLHDGREGLVLGEPTDA